MMRNFVLLTINFIGLYCTEFYDYELAEDDMTSGYIPGDYVIGALFPVHFFFDDDNSQCISINEYDGIQAVEAAFFAVDMINSNEDILPNLTLGIDIKDYCNSVEVVTLQTKKLVDKSISRSNATKDIFSNTQKEIHSPLIGIIGPDSSILSIEVQSILRFFSIVQIGYSEPILDLFEDKTQLYPYFMSIVPENVFMTEGIIKILEAFNWTYVSLVHSVDSFGLSGLRHFQKLASKRGICIADIIESDTLNTIDSGGISNVMPSYQQVDVIVCYDSSSHMNLLLHKMKSEEHLNKRFVIIGGDGWPPRRSNRQRYEELAVGELAISLKQSYIQQFDDYYLSRNLQNNKRNPWFEEFWENHFKCKIKSSANHSEYLNTCTGEEVLKEKYEQNPKVPYIIKSVYALAHALHDMLKSGCTDVHKGALPMQNAFYKTCFKKYVQKVNFSFFGDQFNFKHERMPANIRYNIHNFQKTEDGSYDYVLIGDFTETELNRTSKKVLRLYSAPQFPENKTIKSTCSEPCSPKHAKVLRKDKCCWDCVQCKPLEILVNSEQCLVCKQGFMSNENKTGCIPIPVRHTTPDTQILIPMIFSAFSILLISTILLVFIRFRNTPVVQSSTKELCYVIFAGMLLANVNSFITVLSPSTIACAAIRIIPAISFAMMYAALLVKTNRVARILAISKKKYPNLNARFLSLRAQIIITSVLISIEAGICVHSLHKNHPLPYTVYREKNHTYYGEEMCPLNEEIIIDTFSYIFILLLICTYYAIKTRNWPANFNETRCTGFAMYASILMDLVFAVMIYLGNEWRILILNLCASVNSLIMLITLFSPKLYIILWTPEKNNRIYFKTSTNIRSYFDSEKRSEGRGKSTHYNRFNGDSISLETTATEISISRL